MLLGACCAVSAQSWLPLRSRMESDPSLKGENVVVLLDSTGVTIDENGSGKFLIHKVVRVQNPKGRLSLRTLKYDYDPLTAMASFRRVTIWKKDGSREDIDTDKAQLDYAAPARSIYWGARQIMIGLGALEDGDIIDYEIDKKGFTYALLGGDEDRFIPPMRGNFYDIVPFWVENPTISKIYSIDAPASKDVQYEFYQGTCRSSVRLNGDRRMLTFEVDDQKPFQKEPNMVDLYDVAPKLMLSSTKEWKDKSLWFYGVNEDYGSFDPYTPAQKKVDELIRGKKTDMEKIAVLTHWVADNMRYSGISMGKGEGYTLHNTKTNFTDRCGVCKDKAALLISMLRMAGFEAYPAMTMAGSRIESIPADHFNHCVAVVKLANGTYMPLDPTWVPFKRELWSSAEQQQNYLPGVPEGSDLCLTPVSAPENHYLKINVVASLSPDGTLSGKYIVKAEGQSDGTVHSPFTTGYVSQIRNALETELLRLSPKAEMTAADCGKNPSDYQAAPANFTISFRIPGYAMKASDGSLFYKPLCGQLYPRVETYRRIDTSLEARKYGFNDSCSRLVELSESVTLPSGYSLKSGACSIEKPGNAVSFSGKVAQSGKNVLVEHRLSLGKRVYDASDWDEFREAVNAQKGLADATLVFTK